MEQCYVYKWTHLPTLKWYVGSRTARGCHPDDGYICSSKIVKPLIKANPNEWSREIIAVGSRDEMRELEADILEMFEAHKDPRSFNQSNSAGAIIAVEPWNKNKRGVQVAWNKGLPKESQPNYGKKHPGKHWTRSEKGETMLDKLRETNKMRNTEKLVCPNCQKAGEGPAMKRWHFANCRQEGGK